MTVDDDGGLTDVEGTERMQHLAPPGDIGSGIFVRRRPGETSLRHQETRGDILDSDHPESGPFENAAYSRQQMIISSPECCDHARDDAKRRPVEANFGQRRPHQRADENQIAAVFRASQFGRPADLADCNPVMAKTLYGDRIAGAAQRQNNGIDPSCNQ